MIKNTQNSKGKAQNSEEPCIYCGTLTRGRGVISGGGSYQIEPKPLCPDCVPIMAGRVEELNESVRQVTIKAADGMAKLRRWPDGEKR